MSSAPIPEGVPPGAPVVPQGPVPAVGIPNSQDYPRLVYTAPRFEVVAIADIIEPSVLEACEALLPTLVPPYVNQAAIDAVNATAVRRAGDTMTGPLNLSPVIPTADAMAASKQYVDTMIATGAIPEVPPVPSGQAWARETGQWVPIAGGGTVTNIATGAGLTGGPITATGTIAMANMNGNTLKGNATGAVAAPTDLNVGQVMTMLGAAPLNSPNFTGTPTLPTGTQAVTQSVGVSNTTVATTAFVAASVAPYAPLASPVFTGSPSFPTGAIGVTQAPGDNDTSLATTAFVAAAVANCLPLTGGTLAGPGNLTVRGGILGGAAGTVPGPGALTLNANTVAPPAVGFLPTNLRVVGADGGNMGVALEAFGGAPLIIAKQARGTAASPAPTQLNDIIFRLNPVARGATVWDQNTLLDFFAAENFTDSAQGTGVVFQTCPIGTIGQVASLRLQGNSAVFSGTVVVPGNFYFGAAAAASAANIIADASNVYFHPPAGGGGYFFQNTAASVNLLSLDNGGNLTISGATATKASGTTWANPSARDLKQNIQPYAQGLDAVLALKPCTYEFAADSGIAAAGPHIGLIHDETAHMPEMHRTLTIGGDADQPGREVDGLDCSAVTWALVNAIKELKAEIDSLKAGRT